MLKSHKIMMIWCRMRCRKIGFAVRTVAAGLLMPCLPHLSAQRSFGRAALFATAVIRSGLSPAKLASLITKTSGRTGAIAGFEH